MGPFQIILFIVWALSTLALIALVLMHSGKGTGVSDMIASSLYNSSAATGVMEQNLDKLTVIVAVVFAACVVLGPSGFRAARLSFPPSPSHRPLGTPAWGLPERYETVTGGSGRLRGANGETA